MNDEQALEQMRGEKQSARLALEAAEIELAVLRNKFRGQLEAVAIALAFVGLIGWLLFFSMLPSRP